MAERPLRAYDGDESYIFLAYSNEDSELVFPQIRWLQDQGFNRNQAFGNYKARI
jgi:hypothetical protein